MSRKRPDHVAAWLRLHLAAKVGPKTFAKLLEAFGDIQGALTATGGQLQAIPGIGRKTAAEIIAGRDGADVEAELDLADRMGVDIFTLACGDYPPLLRQIPDPPAVLYVKGVLRREDNLAVALVGSRSCSQYGREQASRLAHLLAASGFTIVSGLARGIDTAAHRGALAAGGRTIAVQGCGLAKIYPPENIDLAAAIAENGAVVSELPLTFEPLAGTFPTRNRIIAGLSLGTLVVEARPNSGALITARQAMEQNREVMAVPGRVDAPGSGGCHRLIKDGAQLVENIQDVLDALGALGPLLSGHANAATTAAESQQEATLFDAPTHALNEAEAAVLGQLDHEPRHIDELIAALDRGAGAVNAAVTGLQLKGLVKQLPGSYYQRRGPG